ncbi:MAG: hypothetical protein R3183_11730, partial [Oleiphilaceae bacterium]|nr:hypothetical protein [Oleiphilaceae bacterium]
MSVPEYVLLAKQAIYRADKHPYAYELLFRSPLNLRAVDLGGDIATSQVLVNYCASVSHQADQTTCPVFINVEASYVKSHDGLPVSPDRVIIELNNYQCGDAELIASVEQWRKQGYRFSLDDVDLRNPPKGLLPFAEYAKVDVLDIDWLGVSELLAPLRREGL